MTDYFVDGVNGNDGNSGLTLDLAWETVDFALTDALTNDNVWIRRNLNEVATSHLVKTSTVNPSPAVPTQLIGCPRNSLSITSATWTNGSTTVDNILPATMSTLTTCSRYITAPNGTDYLITQITDANTIVIDRLYPGATVTLTDGASTIHADEDYALFQTLTAAEGTITLADWNADSDVLPTIDFNSAGGSFQLQHSSGDLYCWWKNMYFTNSATHMISISAYGPTSFRGCIFETTANAINQIIGSTVVNYFRCIFVGSGVGNTANDIFNLVACTIYLKDCAIYDAGGDGIYTSSSGIVKMDNVNIGIEEVNNTSDLAGRYWGLTITGTDVNLGQGVPVTPITSMGEHHGIENFGKVQGSHYLKIPAGVILSAVAGAGGDIANQRLGGSASLIEITHNITAKEGMSDWNQWMPIFDHEFNTDTTNKSYRYYVQSMGILTAGQLYIECEYVSDYDDTTKYSKKTVESVETFTARADADDWAEYMEVTNIQPAIASKVRIKCYCRYYHASNKIYIDPAVEIDGEDSGLTPQWSYGLSNTKYNIGEIGADSIVQVPIGGAVKLKAGVKFQS